MVASDKEVDRREVEVEEEAVEVVMDREEPEAEVEAPEEVEARITAPVEVESLLTRPVENAVGVVNNVVRVTSSSRAVRSTSRAVLAPCRARHSAETSIDSARILSASLHIHPGSEASLLTRSA